MGPEAVVPARLVEAPDVAVVDGPDPRPPVESGRGAPERGPGEGEGVQVVVGDGREVAPPARLGDDPPVPDASPAAPPDPPHAGPGREVDPLASLGAPEPGDDDRVPLLERVLPPESRVVVVRYVAALVVAVRDGDVAGARLGEEVVHVDARGAPGGPLREAAGEGVDPPCLAPGYGAPVAPHPVVGQVPREVSHAAPILEVWSGGGPRDDRGHEGSPTRGVRPSRPAEYAGEVWADGEVDQAPVPRGDVVAVGEGAQVP